MDAYFAVGSIIGIWTGQGLLNRNGSSQCAALIAQYGPKVTVALALNGSSTVNGDRVCLELTMLPHSWIVTIPKIQIKATSKIFAPGNLRATADNAQYCELVQFWLRSKYTLRYSGGLVPDVYHILVKRGGVFTNVASTDSKAKLRLLYTHTKYDFPKV